MKNQVLYMLLTAVVIVAFNILFFLWVNNPSSADWICYSAITGGCLFVCGTMIFPPSGRENTYEMALPNIAISYLVLAVVIGILFMILHIGFAITLTVYLILALATLLWFIANVVVARKTALSIAAQKDSAETLRNYAFELQMLNGRISDPTLKKAVNHLEDTIKCSPMLSSAGGGRNFAAEIASEMKSLENAVAANDIVRAMSTVNTLEQLYARRNRY